MLETVSTALESFNESNKESNKDLSSRGPLLSLSMKPYFLLHTLSSCYVSLNVSLCPVKFRGHFFM